MKIQNIILLPFFLILILSISCTKIPLYKSSDSETRNGNETKYSIAKNYNPRKNFHFGTINNDSNLVLQFYFHQQEDLFKIMRGGLLIYFDNEAIKNKDYVLKIEKGESRTGLKPNSNKTLNTTQFPQNGTQNLNYQGQIAEMLCRDMEKVTWKKNEKEFVFYRSTFKNSIGVEVESNSPSALIVTIQMPVKELDLKENKLFSIGIETGTSSLQANNPFGGNTGNMQGRSGGGGSRGSGMGGGPGKGRGGMNSGMQAGSGQGASRNQTSLQPFKFWFQVQL